MAGYRLKWLKIARKHLEMAGKERRGLKMANNWLEMTGNSWKWLEQVLYSAVFDKFVFQSSQSGPESSL